MITGGRERSLLGCGLRDLNTVPATKVCSVKAWGDF